MREHISSGTSQQFLTNHDKVATVQSIGTVFHVFQPSNLGQSHVVAPNTITIPNGNVPSTCAEQSKDMYVDSYGGQYVQATVSTANGVSNGFVKDGRSLPYVFESQDSGRKRHTKILPVCGVCGKSFVCVTTMKRHLVTHTGEKPFTCNICGKHYTQKGNLRVHERTHRNDRPFQCPSCHQRFYRKEPMQKHQWRQHGIMVTQRACGEESGVQLKLNISSSSGSSTHDACESSTIVSLIESKDGKDTPHAFDVSDSSIDLKLDGQSNSTPPELVESISCNSGPTLDSPLDLSVGQKDAMFLVTDDGVILDLSNSSSNKQLVEVDSYQPSTETTNAKTAAHSFESRIKSQMLACNGPLSDRYGFADLEHNNNSPAFDVNEHSYQPSMHTRTV